MQGSRMRGPGPSLMLISEARAGNAVGIDPHKRTLTAIVVDARGGIVAGEHFKVSGDGHRALEAWARSFGPVIRWGVENAAGWGRHPAIYLAGRGHDVRDVCPNRTPRQDRGRQRGKSDTLDGERIARETLADLPLALRDQLPDTKTVRPRLAALARRNRRRRWDAATALRLRMLDDHHA